MVGGLVPNLPSNRFSKVELRRSVWLHLCLLGSWPLPSVPLHLVCELVCPVVQEKAIQEQCKAHHGPYPGCLPQGSAHPLVDDSDKPQKEHPDRAREL